MLKTTVHFMTCVQPISRAGGHSPVLAPWPTLRALHAGLLAAYGPQGWWPLLGHAGVNPTKSGSVTGYHPGDYSFPHTPAEAFEIGCGAILTQNTAWPNVEKALLALHSAGWLGPAALLAAPPPELALAIRPAGYFNSKAEKLRHWATFWRALRPGETPSRERLLAVWGIGPETADSIRLYAFGQREMVVDAYARRVLSGLGFCAPDAGYDALKQLCINALPARLEVYLEFHALLVEHAKRLRAIS